MKGKGKKKKGPVKLVKHQLNLNPQWHKEAIGFIEHKIESNPEFKGSVSAYLRQLVMMDMACGTGREEI